MSLGNKNINLAKDRIIVNIIDNDFYTATLDTKGNWITKAKLVPLKGKEGNDLKYKDVPRFPVIYEYEDQFKDSYKNTLFSMVADIGKKLIQIHKRQTN